MDYEAFRGFLKGELERRKMSVTEFAMLVKVSHTTILRFIADKPAKVYIPTVELLDKLSVATGVSLNTLLAVCFPETARKLEIDPDVAIICDIVSRLPVTTRQAVLRYIRSFEE